MALIYNPVSVLSSAARLRPRLSPDWFTPTLIAPEPASSPSCGTTKQLAPLRLQNAPDNSFEEYPTWISDGLLQHAQGENAYLAIYAQNPDLLAGQDPEKLATIHKTGAKHNEELSKLAGAFAYNWLIVSVPTVDWASKIFPDLSADEQTDALWEKIFQLARIDTPDPVAAWDEHLTGLKQTAAYLNAKQYDSLHYTGPGTDLTIGLPEGHVWIAAQTDTPSGITFTPNMPTEEVFTTPHKDRTSGTVAASMPLNYSGMLIENFSLTFEDGVVTNVSAEKGEETLSKMIETDEGAARLGEVALVPHNSPIAQTGLLFYNTLFDENAACHIALGRGFKDGIEGGSQFSDEEWAQQGGNISLIHTDFMIGF